MIKYFLAVFAMVLTYISAQAQKIEGAGIPPSKVQAYSGESSQYTVSGLDGHLTWDVTYGQAGSPFGFSQTEITWNITSEGKITVRNDKGQSVQATVQVAPPMPEFKFVSESSIHLSNVKDCSYYQWTIPNDLKIQNQTGTFRIKKQPYVFDESFSIYNITSTPKQLYYENTIKVQAISDINSLLSRTATYKYVNLNLDYLKIQFPETIDYQEQYTVTAENIEGATYKWIVSEGATIVSGQNTNKIIINPNNSLWTTGVELEFTYRGITKRKDVSTFIKMQIYIDGPTDVKDNEFISYTVKTPLADLDNLCGEYKDKRGWYLDGNLMYSGNKYNIRTDTISAGSHEIKVYSLIPPFSASKIINKHSSQLYQIEQSENNLVISKKDESINTLSSINDNTNINIYTQQGFLVLSKRTSFKTDKIYINLDEVKSGIYFVTIFDGISKTTQKVIIK